MHFVFTPQLNLQLYMIAAKTPITMHKIQGLMHSADSRHPFRSHSHTIRKSTSLAPKFEIMGFAAQILGIHLLLLHSRTTPLTIPSPQMRPTPKLGDLRGDLRVQWMFGIHFTLTHPPAPMNHVKNLRAGPAEMPFRNWYTANTNHFHLTDSVRK